MLKQSSEARRQRHWLDAAGCVPCFLPPGQVKPTHVVNCAGKVGTPNVDWCETHKVRA